MYINEVIRRSGYTRAAVDEFVASLTDADDKLERYLVLALFSEAISIARSKLSGEAIERALVLQSDSGGAKTLYYKGAEFVLRESCEYNWLKNDDDGNYRAVIAAIAENEVEGKHLTVQLKAVKEAILFNHPKMPAVSKTYSISLKRDKSKEGVL